MKKAYIYTRVSTAVQVEGYSLDAQEKTLMKFADAKDMVIVGKYSDEGRSGKNIENRPAFQQMLKDIKNHKDDVSAVLVFKLSRFGRNTLDVLESFDILKSHGCSLICSEEPIDTSTAMGEVFLTILAAIATMERENIAIQTMAGRIEKAEAGKWNGGFAPYGYMLVDGKLVIDEEEAEIIRLIFDKYVSTGMGYNGVAKWLEENGYQKKVRQNGKLAYFSEEFVKCALDNCVYNGKIHFGKRKQEKSKTGKVYAKEQSEYLVAEGIHEAIIDDETWRLAQEKREKTKGRQQKKYDLEHYYQLSGIVKCPICGKGLVGQPNHKRRSDGTRYTSVYSYRCNNHDCNYRNLPNEKRINGAVEEILTALVSNPKFAQKMKDRVDQKVDYSELDATIDRLSQQIKQTIQRKDRLISQIDNLDISDSHYDRKVTDLEKRLDDAYERIGDAEALLSDAEERKEKVRQEQINGEIVYKNLLIFDKVISKCSDIEKKKLYELLIKEIQIYETPQEDGRQIKSIIFNFPVMYGKDEVDYMCLSEKQIDETVCLLSNRKSRQSH